MNWKLAAIASGVVFALLTSSLVVMGITPVSTGSPYKTHGQIRIDQSMDPAFFTSNVGKTGVTSGQGTASDPFVIEGWEFDSRAVVAIMITNVTAHFIIRDISIHAPLNPSVPGIWLTDTSYVQIANVTIQGRSIGIKVELSKPTNTSTPEPTRDIFITDSRILECPIGIQINDTGNVGIRNNMISRGIDAGIFLRRCVATEISDNIIAESARHGKDTIASVRVAGSNQTSILGNRIVNSGENGIEIIGSNDTTISDNKFGFIVSSWLSVTDSDFVYVIRNIAQGTGNRSSLATDSGLYFLNVTQALVQSNELIRYGISMTNISQCVLVFNTLTNGTGLELSKASISTIWGNVLHDIEAPPSIEWHALRVSASNNITLQDNVFQASPDSTGGVFDIAGLDYSAFSHNVLQMGNSTATDHLSGRFTTVNLNMMEGTNLSVAGDNLSLIGNNFTAASLTIGVKDSMLHDNSFWDGSSLTQVRDTNRTDIYHNDFMAGTRVTTVLVRGNAWDDGYPSGGNYWQDNVSADVNSGADQNVSGADGICDMAVVIPGGALDRYPMVAPVRTADSIEPISSATVVSGKRGTNGWFLGPVDVEISASDDSSGVANTSYSVDSGAFTTLSGKIHLAADGNHLLAFRSVDKNGNEEPIRSILVNIDSTSPTVQITAPPTGTWLAMPTMVIRWNSVDATSGMSYNIITEPKWKSARPDTRPYLLLTSMQPRHYLVNVTAVDDAGNSAMSSMAFVITYDHSITSWHGPWGALFNIVLLFDLLSVAAFFFFMRKYRASTSGLVDSDAKYK